MIPAYIAFQVLIFLILLVAQPIVAIGMLFVGMALYAGFFVFIRWLMPKGKCNER